MVTEQEIAKAKETHPELLLLTGMDEQILVRPPTPGEYKKFRTMVLSTNPDVKGQAPLALVLDCVVVPDRQEVMQILDRRPGLVDRFGDRCAELAGALAEIEAKKV